MRRLILSVLVTTLAIAASGAIAQTSSGTAFAVAPEILVTNQHVVAGCSSVEVISADGRRKGSVVVEDADIDLALLRVSGLKGSTARLRNPRVVRLGESVMVFGYPLAGALSSGGNVTTGVVSALRGLRDAAGEIQITAPVQPGNSGGPVMDASGLVIGVVQRKLDALRAARATGDIPQNVNFAISLEVLADFLAKNRVAFHDAALSAPLDTARVAELAQSVTHRVECRGKSQQAKAPAERAAAERTAADKAAADAKAVAELGPQRQPSLMEIKSSDLQDEGRRNSVIVLNAVLRNQAQFAQEYPALELTLTDERDEAVARRVLMPTVYLVGLPAKQIARGIGAGADAALRVYFDTGGLRAVGYTMYLFYPAQDPEPARRQIKPGSIRILTGPELAGLPALKPK